jgi:hypothetical protein
LEVDQIFGPWFPFSIFGVIRFAVVFGTLRSGLELTVLDAAQHLSGAVVYFTVIVPIVLRFRYRPNFERAAVIEAFGGPSFLS